MARFLVGTKNERTSDALCRYLETRLTEADELHVVNSLPGGNDEALVEAGRAALDRIEERFGDRLSVETRQFTGGNGPTHDILSHADAVDAHEIIIGLNQKKSAVKKVVIGDITQSVLFRTNRPVMVVPLPEEADE